METERPYFPIRISSPILTLPTTWIFTSSDDSHGHTAPDETVRHKHCSHRAYSTNTANYLYTTNNCKNNNDLWHRALGLQQAFQLLPLHSKIVRRYSTLFKTAPSKPYTQTLKFRVFLL